LSYKITKLIAAELAAHEGIVVEAYRDTVGVWTWGIGVTSRSGHKVWQISLVQHYRSIIIQVVLKELHGCDPSMRVIFPNQKDNS